MRKVRLTALTLALCTALSACSRFVPSSYTRVSAHSQTQAEQQDSNVVNVGDYAGLRRAIRDFVRGGVEHGVIRAQQYTGVLEDDLAAAAYSVAREDPAGAYAVDYMTHECTLIVSYYEIHVDITFRETKTALSDIPYVSNTRDLERRLRESMDNYDPALTVYAGYAQEPDYAALARDYYEENLDRLMAMPEVTLENYPQGATPRIAEVSFAYPEPSRTLESMAKQVADTLSAASVYVRIRESDWDKMQLLYSYLTERFSYTERETKTPVYSLLCEGYATSWSMAQSWALLCREAGLECQVVEEQRDGEDYWWNLISLDSQWYHLDLMQDVLSQTGLKLRYDEDMADYSWDREQYPACPAPEEPEAPTGEESAPETPVTPETPAEPEQPENPSGETPSEQPSETPEGNPDTILQNYAANQR